jgi:alginate O-acetyltransferase complex protein AlgI
MLFNSYEFIYLYLPIVFFGFFWVAKSNHHLAALWLAVASLFFYGWWNLQFVLLLLASIVFNYAMGYAIGYARSGLSPPKQSTRLLVVAVVGNLLLLGYFKYMNFFISTVNQIVGSHWGAIDIVLPLGISFFTFTQIAFLVDVHRGIASEYSFIHYLLFVTYFPHLIAGPILHHKQLMPQFGQAATYKINVDNVNIGLAIFIIGLFKKVVLADHFALYATPVFDAIGSGGEPKIIEAWLGTLAYTLQLYFDFSGYSDMAIGISKMFNVNLPLNFNSPYKAANIIEFWRRWHMTLSTFLRDYLYFPLGGNRCGATRRYANLMATMLLGGLWHGANWTFVLWGGVHGVYLIVNHVWQSLCRGRNLPRILRSKAFNGGLTFVAVVIAWVPFRSNSIDAATRMLKGMSGMNGLSLPSASAHFWPDFFGYFALKFEGAITLSQIKPIAALLSIGAGLGIVWLLPSVGELFIAQENPLAFALFRGRKVWRNVAYSLFLAILFLTASAFFYTESPFLYFQF